MARTARADSRPVSGIVLVDKPAGLTSNRVLQQVKRLFRARKAGHTGTLDPLATGLLPVCLGAATRVTGLMLDASKRYQVTAEFGIATDTGDAAGSVVERRAARKPDDSELTAALAQFRGRILQTPPMYSALKHEGRRLYELARQGKQVERPPREVEIFDIVLESVAWPRMTLSVHCSKGTYIRSLVTDIAATLGSVAHVQALRRTAVGPFDETQMHAMETLERLAGEGADSLDRCLLPIDAALQDRPSIRISEAEAAALRQGRRIVVRTPASGPSVRVYDPVGTLVGLGDLSATGELRPDCIFPA
jgi:tRNA pseudouridine55 synthase